MKRLFNTKLRIILVIAVLVTAPFEDRVEIVRKKRGLNKKKGAKLVKHIDGYKSTVIGLPVERLVKEFPDLI